MATAITFAEAGTDSTQDFLLYGSTSVVNGTITSDSTIKHTGPRSIKSEVTASASGNKASCSTSNNTPNGATVLNDAGSAISHRVRFSSVAPSTPTMFSAATNATDTTILAIGLNTDGTIRICGRGATAVNGAVALSATTWYRISIGYIITTSTNWSMTVRIYDDSNTLLETISTSNTQGTLGAVTTTLLRLGINGSGSVDTWGTPSILTVWFDDIYVDNRTDKTDPGNVSCTSKRPNADGTTNGFSTQVGSGGSGYGSGHSPQVNEQPLSITNGWSMVGAGSAITEEYNVEGVATGDVDITSATIVGYMGWAYAKALVAESGRIILNGTNQNFDIGTANTFWYLLLTSASYLGGSGADVGITTTTALTTVSLYECGVVVAYIAAAVGGSSIKTVNGLAYASIKTVNGLAIASVKTINGLA